MKDRSKFNEVASFIVNAGFKETECIKTFFYNKTTGKYEYSHMHMYTFLVYVLGQKQLVLKQTIADEDKSKSRLLATFVNLFAPTSQIIRVRKKGWYKPIP